MTESSNAPPPRILPVLAVEYWLELAAGHAQRTEGRDPLPLTLIGFYSNEHGVGIAHVLMLSNWEECRVVISVANRRYAGGMTPMTPVKSVTHALRAIQDTARGGVITALVYVRDVTIGGKYALFSTVYIRKRRGASVGTDPIDEAA